MSLSATPSAWGILPSEWLSICQELQQPAFRAKQIVTGLYQDFAESWENVTTLPAGLRTMLAERFPLAPLTTVQTSNAEDGVCKLLLSCADGESIETVIIPSKDRVTQCISTQVGCALGCAFCASGKHGFTRDLTAAEIVAQVMAVCRILRDTATALPMSPRPGAKPALPRPGNIVVMGMGEPFANYDNVMRALRILNHQQGLNIGARHITISTCGLVPGIRRLAEEGLQFELSVSLHAPDDELRGRIMPVNRRWPLQELLETCRTYNEKTGRLVTFEYTLIKKLNDRPEHAARLIRLLRHMPCKVNLIPLSPVDGFDGRRPEHADCLAFLDALLKAKINTTMRRSRGRDVDAACGQLRLRSLNQPPQTLNT
ncbi:MAG: 23S rRNA (adenine(2503)-C(2))-methyltransferase RlmN [Kiritimatiellae bacterium]|nr:23S rRNA (adenine(2503)-C(2))-methyltransferase RlmN [Kiritimatiellia bacterium]